MKKNIKRATSITLVLILLTGVFSLTSCGAPKLEAVKDDFIKLIEASYEVNEILFGDGLSGYGILKYDETTGTYYYPYYVKNEGRFCAYRDKELGKYIVLRVSDTDGEGCVYKNEARGRYYFPTDLEYSEGPDDLPDTPLGYRHVRADERCTTINEIAAMASAVYSEDYLGDIFTVLLDSNSATNIDATYSSKYIEMKDPKTGETYLLCADEKTCPPIDNGDRIFDFDSMKIARRSRRKYVRVELMAYGKYADIDLGEVVTGWHKVELSFVMQNGEWRLDSPTY